MKTKAVPISWVLEDEHRLDCGPFTRGGIEAKKMLEATHVPKDKLVRLTRGGLSGMYHVGMDKLRWVEGPNHGVPFLRSADILRNDLSEQPFISRQQVAGNPLFKCPPGTTLITRSGTIGRMAYCRSDMAEMAISQDVLKVVPNNEKVLSGYLFAFLSSKFGVPLIVSGTFGSIIVHIEAENIAELPVPRLGAELERRTHDLVDVAAKNRTRAVDLLTQAARRVRALLGAGAATQNVDEGWTLVNSARLQARCDAYYFSTPCESARRAFDTAAVEEHHCLSEVADVFIPGIFKRQYADDDRFGVPYITGGDVFELAPKSEQYLMHRVVSEKQLSVEEGTILIQEAGQLGGLIGRSVMVGSYLDGFAVSNNMVRVKAHDRRDGGYLFSILSTEEGVRLIAREAAGSSIPHMDASRLRKIRLPWPTREQRHEVSALVDEAIKLRDIAAASEDEGRALVERAIEEAA